MEGIDGLLDFLLANPLLLIPILLIAATMLYAALKKLLKIAAIASIAGVLYLLLIEYFGTGI